MIYFLIIFIICYVGYSQFKTTNQLRQEVAVEQKVTEIKLRFFTNISHELRTPLTLITGPVETVLREEQLSQVARTQLEIVKSNAQRMLRLINQILDFRKIQNNKMQLRVQYADVSALAKATFGNFVREAADKHIDFQFENHMNNPMGWVDSEKVDTIIYNLLSNAFKFTPSGKSIKLRVSDNEEYLILEVSDTGIGIPKDKRSVLFQRFSSNNEINASQEKTGTGVAHCPISNMKLSSGVARIPEMLALDVPVGLAVDGSASNDGSSLMEELRVAYLLHRLSSSDKAPSGYQVLKMATRGSARLLGREDIGQLAVGKCADLFLVDSRHLELVGGEYSPADVLATVGLRGPVDYTVVNGKVVVKEGHLVTVDEEKVAEDARNCCQDYLKNA